MSKIQYLFDFFVNINSYKDKVIASLMRNDECVCNLTEVQNSIRENAIGISENKFVIGVHRERINENENNIEVKRSDHVLFDSVVSPHLKIRILIWPSLCRL